MRAAGQVIVQGTAPGAAGAATAEALAWKSAGVARAEWFAPGAGAATAEGLVVVPGALMAEGSGPMAAAAAGVARVEWFAPRLAVAMGERGVPRPSGGVKAKRMTAGAWAAVLVMVAALGAAAAEPSYENLNAVSWMQTSAEYRALALQTYRAAESSLERALADPTWTAALEQTEPAAKLPPAIILDLDETVLDNSAYQARLTLEGGTFNDKTWGSWVAEARAGLVPGAAQFLAFAHSHGVAIFYVTNRVCDAGSASDPTVVLLRKHNLPLAPGRLRCKTDMSSKSPRRAAIAQTHRIVLMFGDDYGDFLAAGSGAADRAQAVLPYERWFGERWFVLPNPSYGSWEGAVGHTTKEKLEKLRK